MKTVAVLGCTGSIGQSALKVISSDADMRVGLLANYGNLDGLKKLIRTYSPAIAVCVSENYLYKDGREYVLSNNPLEDADIYADCDVVVNGIVGLAGLKPSLAAVRAGKILATANKESFVCAGTIINDVKKQTNGVIYPLDSEHSAVWQLIDGKSDVSEIIITASGGAFRDLTKEELKYAKASDALKHPNWKMGKKVTVDCATLVNKGMEIIEAKHLFGIKTTAIGHRESIIHALVKHNDGTLSANLSAPDMVTPIAYALNYPKSARPLAAELDLSKLGSLNFYSLDENRFPCLRLAKNAAKCGDVAGCVFNAADEVLVNAYIDGVIGFYDVAAGIDKAMNKFACEGNFEDLDALFRMDKAVREYTLYSVIGGRG